MKHKEIHQKVVGLINTKKIITPVIKSRLIELGFKETIIGTKKEHEINSKEIKLNFNNYDIAIGLAAKPTGKSCGRRYYAMTINFNE